MAAAYDRLQHDVVDCQQGNWEEAWKIVASLEHLRSLHVYLRMKAPFGPPHDVMHRLEETIFCPMRQVKHVPDYRVEVHWFVRYLEGDPEGHSTPNPFELRRTLYGEEGRTS